MGFKKYLGALLFSVPLVSAQQLPSPPVSLDGVKDLFSILLSNTAGANSEIVARILIFSVLAIVLYKPALNIVKDEKWGAILSIIVSMLAVRFLDAKMVNGLALPYGVLGITLSIIIPFLLLEYFLLVQDDTLPRAFRTAGYLIMAGTFTGLWWFRWTELGDLAYYYLGATVLCLLAFWFDGTFRRWIFMSKHYDRQDREIHLAILELQERAAENEERRLTADKDQMKLIDQVAKEINDKIRELQKRLGKH